MILCVVGLTVLAGAYFVSLATTEGARRFWFAYLTSFAFMLSLSLGGLFFVMLQFLVRAGWSVAVRRPAEIIAANLPLLAIFFLPLLTKVLADHGTSYPWSSTISARPTIEPVRLETGGDLPLAHFPAGSLPSRNADSGKDSEQVYLNPKFFTARWIVFLVLWSALSLYFWKQSTAQDIHGNPLITLSLQKLSGPGIAIVGLTLTFASWDLLMSLSSGWLHPLMGVYFFTGAMTGFLSLHILILAGLQYRGIITRTVQPRHYHDLGRLLFGSVFLWAYVGLGQYFLIRYTDLPGETAWLARRGLAENANTWSAVSATLLFGHFLIPTAVMLFRRFSLGKGGLAFLAIWMLTMHWLDIYWLIMPEMAKQERPLLVELMSLAGLGLLFAAGALRNATGRSLIPIQDPRLAESVLSVHP